jgi:hypothetical protein
MAGHLTFIECLEPERPDFRVYHCYFSQFWQWGAWLTLELTFAFGASVLVGRKADNTGEAPGPSRHSGHHSC